MNYPAEFRFLPCGLEAKWANCPHMNADWCPIHQIRHDPRPQPENEAGDLITETIQRLLLFVRHSNMICRFQKKHTDS